jgi:3',5'-cyclic-AMP phosphodiesterase
MVSLENFQKRSVESTVSLATNQQAPLRVVQITDCHLGERVGARLLNLDTDRSLAAVLDLVRTQQPHIDVVLATGDLSDQGSAAAYRRFLNATRDLSAHARWLPGDDAVTMRRALAGDARMQRNLLLDKWQIIMLDSAVPGEVGGYLDESELVALRSCLRAAPQHYALICVHHHALPVGCDWLDTQLIANAEQFWAVIDEFPQVRAVLSGHVHQRCEIRRKQVRVLTSPSTCIQFAPNSVDFRVDNEAPGYRWFDLHDDGRFHTEVERVSTIDCEIDLTATGY